MERKKIQRIVGIVIVISLVIVILPLLFGENSPTLQAKTLVPPQGSSTTAENAFNPRDFDLPVTDTKVVAEKQVQQNTLQPQWVSHLNEIPVTSNTAQPEKIAPLASNRVINKPVNKPMLPLKTLDKPATAPTAVTHTLVRNNTVAPKKTYAKITTKLNEIGWVVQMGNFKSKPNAQRLTDQLRSAGFKAFTYDVKGSKGVRTRVYVGPEFKQVLAKQIRDKVADKTHLQGYVVNYQPLDI